MRWHTPGLDQAVRTDWLTWAACRGDQLPWRPRPDLGRSRVAMRNGLIVMTAGPQLLRQWAVDIATLGEDWYEGMDYAYLDTIEPESWHGRRGPDLPRLSPASQRADQAI